MPEPAAQQAQQQAPVTPASVTPVPANQLTPQVQPPETPAADPAQQQPSYVTREEMDQMLRRVRQSDRDRTRNIETQLKGIKEMLEKANTPLTPEAEAALRGQIAEQIDAQEEPDAAAPSQQQRQGQDLGDFQPIFDATMEIYQLEQMDIKPNDPEFKIIEAALNDPNGNMTKYTREVLRAVGEKRERLALQEETADARTFQTGTTPTPRTLTPEQKISQGLSGTWSSQEPKPRRS